MSYEELAARRRRRPRRRRPQSRRRRLDGARERHPRHLRRGSQLARLPPLPGGRRRGLARRAQRRRAGHPRLRRGAAASLGVEVRCQELGVADGRLDATASPRTGSRSPPAWPPRRPRNESRQPDSRRAAQRRARSAPGARRAPPTRCSRCSAGSRCSRCSTAAPTTRSRAARTQAAALTAQAQQAQAAAEQLAPYTSFIALREQRMQAVDALVDSRFDWAHAFHEFGRVLPAQALDLLAARGTVGGDRRRRDRQPAPSSSSSSASRRAAAGAAVDLRDASRAASRRSRSPAARPASRRSR